MKTLLFVLFTLAVTTGASAQTSPVKKAKENHDKKELRDDVREKREERGEVGKDIAHLKMGKAKADHKDFKAEKTKQNKHARKLRNEGVKHPKVQARKEIRKEDEGK
jgi:hypothetical protein